MSDDIEEIEEKLSRLISVVRSRNPTDDWVDTIESFLVAGEYPLCLQDICLYLHSENAIDTAVLQDIASLADTIGINDESEVKLVLGKFGWS